MNKTVVITLTFNVVDRTLTDSVVYDGSVVAMKGVNTLGVSIVTTDRFTAKKAFADLAGTVGNKFRKQAIELGAAIEGA